MYDVIVVGGGPAGLTAALYAARAGRSVLVLEGASPGGQIQYAPLVENYPGMPAMAGSQFAENLSAQAEGLGVTVEYAAVQGFHPTEGGYAVETEEGMRSGRALVLAPGASHRPLGLPGEEELLGAGVSYCAICDGAFYAGKHVAVVGGGDTALQDALFLADVCANVTIIHRRGEFRASPVLVERARGKANIGFLLDTVPAALLQENGTFTGLRVRHTDTGAESVLALDGVFVAVGQVPGTAPFAGQVDLDVSGYFLAGEDCRTNLPGVFAAGDCRRKAVRQLATAVADGAVAGLAAAEFAEERRCCK